MKNYYTLLTYNIRKDIILIILFQNFLNNIFVSHPKNILIRHFNAFKFFLLYLGKFKLFILNFNFSPLNKLISNIRTKEVIFFILN